MLVCLVNVDIFSFNCSRDLVMACIVPFIILETVSAQWKKIDVSWKNWDHNWKNLSLILHFMNEGGVTLIISISVGSFHFRWRNLASVECTASSASIDIFQSSWCRSPELQLVQIQSQSPGHRWIGRSDTRLGFAEPQLSYFWTQRLWICCATSAIFPPSGISFRLSLVRLHHAHLGYQPITKCHRNNQAPLWICLWFGL